MADIRAHDIASYAYSATDGSTRPYRGKLLEQPPASMQTYIDIQDPNRGTILSNHLHIPNLDEQLVPERHVNKSPISIDVAL